MKIYSFSNTWIIILRGTCVYATDQPLRNLSVPDQPFRWPNAIWVSLQVPDQPFRWPNAIWVSIQAHPQFFSFISTSDWHRVRFWVCQISLEFPLPTLPMAAQAIFPLPFCGFCLSRVLANHFGRNWIMLTLNHNSHNPTFLVSL